MYGKYNQVRDGCMTLALMLEVMATSRRTLSDEIASLPPSFTTKDKIKCPAEKISKLLFSLKQVIVVQRHIENMDRNIEKMVKRTLLDEERILDDLEGRSKKKSRK